MNKRTENILYILIRDFLITYLPLQRNCSPNTIRAYKTSLNHLLNYMKEEKNIRLIDISFDMITQDAVSGFLDYLENTKACSIKTRNYRLECLRSFFNYAAMRDTVFIACQIEILKIPFKKNPSPDLIDYMTESAVKSLLDYPDVKKKKGLRNQFLMILMYDTAARVQEIVDLRICDICLDETPQVKLHGKGEKYRSVPIMKETVEHLRKYLAFFHPEESMCSERPLFYSIRKGSLTPLSTDTVRKFMQEYGKELHKTIPEVPENLHPHILRHSRAMHLYQHGMELTLISQWLGHASLGTTLIYAHADTEMKRKAIEKATGEFFTTPDPSTDKYDINDDEVLRRLYGLSD